MTSNQSVDAEVVIPVQWGAVDPGVEEEFAVHLSQLARYCDVTVVDSSAGPSAVLRRIRWAEHVRVLTPDVRWGRGC